MITYRTLGNGLDVVLKENHFVKMVAIQCWVGVGSLYEEEDQRGMAHMIEHMLFKGTKKREVGEISKIIETSGGDINAYTTFDKTVYHLTLSSKNIETGLDVLSDAIYNSSFDSGEIEREKEVVLEEIRRNQDNPASLVGRYLFKELYRGTEASRPIIGCEEDVQKYTREKLLRFYDDWYQPENIKLVVVGDFETDNLFSSIQKYFGLRKNAFSRTVQYSNKNKLKGMNVQLVRGDYQQMRLEVAYEAPPLEHPDTMALDLVAFSLGAGDGSRFNRVLRDELGIVSSIGCSLYSPQFGGMFSLSAFPEQDQYIETVSKLSLEMAKLKNSNQITAEELERARANLKVDRVYQEETVCGQARVLGFGLTTSLGLAYEEVYFYLLDQINAATIESAVERWLDLENVVISGLVPIESSITEEDIKEAYLKGIKQGSAKKKVRNIFGKRHKTLNNQGEPILIELFDGVTLAYRRNLQSNMFTLVAASEGGLRAESDETAGLYNSVSALLANATTKLSYDDLIKIVEGTGATLQGFSGKDSFGLKLQCLTEHTRDLLTILSDSFFNPVFPEQQWGTIKREIMNSIDSEEDSPANIAIKEFQRAIFGTHPYRHPIYGTRNSIEKFNPEMLLSAYLELRDNRPWVFGCVTSYSEKEVRKLLLDSFGGLCPKTPQRVHFPSKLLINSPEKYEKHIVKEREQTHIVVGYRGLDWSDRDRAALDVAATILGGAGGRLFTKLRDQQSLAYSVTPMVTYGCHPGVFGAYIACLPEKASVARDALIDELNLLCEELPTENELERAIQYLIGGHESDLQRSESQAMTMALMEAYGIGYMDFLTYPSSIERVRLEEVRKVARRLIETQNRVVVSVGP
ncbi:MAG: insulinase family protein [Oligoflexales bacterium]|nr:insulinase family protein [Oligoflexales bacterium]